MAKGGKKSGGELRFTTPVKIKSLIPGHSADLYASRILSQLYEPLMVYDVASGSTTYGVAEKLTESKDSKTFTVKLRKGILFHDNDCFGGEDRELKASDVKFTFDHACSGLKKNEISYLLKNIISGAENYFKSTSKSQKLSKSGVSGIKVIDDYTVEFKLTSPHPGFENILSNPSLGIISKKAYKHYGSNADKSPVGSGPFMLESFKDSEIKLKRNPDYWREDEFGNKLPFLANVTVRYQDDKKAELLDFRSQKIDMVLAIPVEEIENIMGTLAEAKSNVKHKLDIEESLSMVFLGMNCKSEKFKNPKVRQAISMGINRSALIDDWMEGEGHAAENGFVPEMGSAYDNSAVNGLGFDPGKAKSLIATAGASGMEIKLYTRSSEGTAIYLMCQGIVDQLKANLGLDAKLVKYDQGNIEAAIDSGQIDFWASGWIADYPDPENFLGLFYGKNIKFDNSLNAFKYNSVKFDKLYAKAS